MKNVKTSLKATPPNKNVPNGLVKFVPKRPKEHWNTHQKQTVRKSRVTFAVLPVAFYNPDPKSVSTRKKPSSPRYTIKSAFHIKKILIQLRIFQVPEETCNLEPQKSCKHVTKLVPLLKPREECVDIPKEVCSRARTNPRKVQKPVVKKWCYVPTEQSGLN